MATERGGRIEANPLDWRELTGQQQAAVERVSEFLLSTVDRVDDRKRARTAPKAQRTSQIMFIDGDRGTGKTTVLLSLQRFTEPDPLEAGEEAALTPTVRRLRERRSRIVWLETMDLEPLRSSNLFAALLVRIERVLDGGPDDGPPLRRYLEDGEGPSKARADLSQLTRDAVLMWERPAPVSEPHVHVHNVLVAERAGLDVNPRMTEVLDRVAKAMSARRGEDPVFVVPVDDFDLAPALCLDLLQLVRMLAIDRLVFVVAGNTRIAESVLQLRGEGELTKLGGKVAEVTALSLEISANNMRKLVPPAQRVPLRRLGVAEAMELPHADLRKWITDVRFESNQAPTGKAEVSMLEWMGLQEGRTASGGWAVAAWLAGTPRQVHDRALLFRQFARAQPDWGEALIAAVLEESRRQIREDWALPTQVREPLAAALQLGARLRLDLQAAGVTARVDYRPQDEWPLDPGRLVHEQASVELWAGERALRAETMTTLLFVHDLAVSLWGAYFPQGSLAAQSGPAARLTRQWPLAAGRVFECHWHVPQWWSFRDFERFDHHWRLHVAAADGRLGEAWLAAILEVVMGEQPDTSTRGRSPARLERLLGALLGERKPKRLARKVLLRSALQCALELAAPECTARLPLVEIFGPHVEALIGDPDLVEGVRLTRAIRWANLQMAPERDESFWRLAVRVASGLVRTFVTETLLAESRRIGVVTIGSTPDVGGLEDRPSAKSPFWVTPQGQSVRAAEVALASPPPDGLAFRELFGNTFDPTPADVARVSQNSRGDG